MDSFSSARRVRPAAARAKRPARGSGAGSPTTYAVEQLVWIFSSTPAPDNLENLFFIDEMTGFMVGKDGGIVKTINGVVYDSVGVRYKGNNGCILSCIEFNLK